MVKQRNDSIAQFEAGKRSDLADAERAELAILGGYLPQRLSEAEIDQAVDAALAAARAAGASGPALIGKAMGALKAQLAGRADMRFGIEMNTDHTLEEVGKQFDVTRERIRQIEAKALRKLRHPSRSEKLRSFLEGE